MGGALGSPMTGTASDGMPRQDASRKVEIVPVIMSGGSGTRLWPLSTEAVPKQFHALTGGRTLLQETVLRLTIGEREPGVAFLAPIVVGNRGHERLVQAQLAAVGIEPLAVVLEPFGRNTAAVAVMAARLVQALRPGALALLAPSDHVIADPAGFHAAVARAARTPDRIVTFGMTPSAPETGYGYVQRGAPLGEAVFEVARFAEKPALDLAKAYVADGGYLWNGGMFLFAPKVMLAEMAAYRPDIEQAAGRALDAAERDGVLVRLDDGGMAAIPSESLDVAVMERTRLAAVAPCDVGWTDVGSWSELWRLNARDREGNLIHGAAVALDTRDCLVWAEEGVEVGCIGLRDMIVVAAGDRVLVAPRERAQDVKALVQQLKAREAD